MVHHSFDSQPGNQNIYTLLHFIDEQFTNQVLIFNNDGHLRVSLTKKASIIDIAYDKSTV